MPPRPHRRDDPLAALRRVRRAAGWLLPAAGLVVVLLVLRGAGVPVTGWGVLIVLVLLFGARFVIGWSRRRRRDRPVTPPRRPR